MDPFRRDDLEGWWQMLRWLRSLIGQQIAIEREARRIEIGPLHPASRAGVFADVGPSDAIPYEDGIARSTGGAYDEATVVLGMRILMVDDPLPMRVVRTTDATRAI